MSGSEQEREYQPLIRTGNDIPTLPGMGHLVASHWLSLNIYNFIPYEYDNTKGQKWINGNDVMGRLGRFIAL